MNEIVRRMAMAMRRRRIELLGNYPHDPVDEPTSIETAIARAGLEAALGWQPIETAPKDETPIDLWCRNISLGSQDAARFADMCWLDGNWEDWHGYILEPKWRPTHWMMPAAPPVESKSEVVG